LAAGRLELGISFLPPSSKALDGERLFSEEIVAVAPVKHALAKRKELKVRELAAWPLVLLSKNYCTRQLIDRAFAEAGVSPEVHVEMNSVESIISTVRQAKMATLLPVLAMCQRERGLKAIRLVEPTPKRAVGLIWLKGAHRRAAAQAFAKVTEQALKDRGALSIKES
jgi:LysR family cyn operon transcriptional activator